jgi:hypothetical protein
MSKDTPQAPQPANPTTVANAQTTSNIGTAAAQQAANNVNTVGPNGSVNYNQTGSYTDPTTGSVLPTYTQTTTLDPLSEAILTGTKQAGASLIPTAQTLAQQAGGAATTPLNFDTADSGLLNSAPQQIDQNAAKASFDAQAGFLKPTYDQQQKDLQDQLSRHGIDVGSDAYNSAETNLANSQNQGLTAASNNAVAGGANSAAQLFNMALQGQQQNIGQQQLRQANPLHLLSQIYGGGGAAA